MSMSTFTEADVILLKNLEYDVQIDDRNPNKINNQNDDPRSDELTGRLLDALSEEPMPFTSFDKKDINPTLDRLVVQPYTAWALKLVRQPADTVFITHILVHYLTLLPSALYLYYNFSWLHGVFHLVYAIWNAGPFTLLLHNHIHNGGILGKDHAIFDYFFPYITGPLMGHTWNSYYFHHVKQHHVENNGPEDLSSTIRYQRDEPLEFLKYFGRFLTLIWIELPLYFFRKNKILMGLKSLSCECSSMGLIVLLFWLNRRAALFTVVLPFFTMRFGMMVGNWGQHCLVDNVEPTSDFRSSITLIDVSSNRHCFNDGYHTSHHLNPRRHWRDHPSAFLKAKKNYQNEGALTFTGIDYLMITFRVLTKDYDTLAKHLVPMGDQISMTHQERVEMLRSKTRRFTEEEIKDKFLKSSPAATANVNAGKPSIRRASFNLASKAKSTMSDTVTMHMNPDLLSQKI